VLRPSSIALRRRVAALARAASLLAACSTSERFAADAGGGREGSGGSGAGGARDGAGGAPLRGGGLPTLTKYIGNIDQRGQIRSDFMMLWNQFTPENAGKWASVEGTRSRMNWATLDRFHDCQDPL